MEQVIFFKSVDLVTLQSLVNKWLAGEGADKEIVHRHLDSRDGRPKGWFYTIAYKAPSKGKGK